MVEIKINIRSNSPSCDYTYFEPKIEVDLFENVESFEMAFIEKLVPFVKNFCKDLEDSQ